jgi:hypothetical protein
MKKFKLSYIDVELFYIKKSMQKPFWSHTFIPEQPCGTPRKSKKWTIKILPFYIFFIYIWWTQISNEQIA